MAHSNRPARTRMVQGALHYFRNFIAVFFAISFFIVTTAATRNPDRAAIADLISPQINSSFSFSPTDPIITGSVTGTFSSATFVGPNRSEKVARRRPSEDVLEFTRAFEEARLKIAALRNPPIVENAPLIRVADIGNQRREAMSRISIAAIDRTLMSAALDAIDDADGSTIDKTLPSPQTASQRLAYARANTPATIFSSPVSMAASKKQLQCLSTAIYFEARGESYRGQIAVAQVVINRVKNKLYPSTICAVVFQNQNKRNACQFSFACDGIPERVTEKKAWAQAEEIAKKVTNGSLYLPEVANATHYHANYVSPRWATRMKKLTQIGVHKFYRFKKGWNWS